jgi:hypothetical protein
LIKYPKFSSSGEFTDKMKFKYLLWILFITNLGGISFSQQKVESNTRVIDRLIDDGILEVMNKLIPLGNDKLFKINYDKQNPEAEYVARKMQSGLQGFKVLLGAFNDSADYVIELSGESINVKYSGGDADNILGTKRVERQVTVKFVSSIKQDNISVKIDEVIFSKTENSLFNEDMLSSVEDSPADFARGILPEEPSAEKVLLPAIMIGISAAAIILFFTIRSK